MATLYFAFSKCPHNAYNVCIGVALVITQTAPPPYPPIPLCIPTYPLDHRGGLGVGRWHNIKHIQPARHSNSSVKKEIQPPIFVILQVAGLVLGQCGGTRGPTKDGHMLPTLGCNTVLLCLILCYDGTLSLWHKLGTEAL